MSHLHVVATQPSSQKQVSVEGLVEALKARTMFTAMREALKREKLPVGQGWADVIANASESTTQGDRFRQFLGTYFAETTITGERYVQLFAVEDDEAKQIAAQMQAAVATSPTFGTPYPLPIPQNELASSSSEPELCEVRPHDNGDFSLILLCSMA